MATDRASTPSSRVAAMLMPHSVTASQSPEKDSTAHMAAPKAAAHSSTSRVNRYRAATRSRRLRGRAAAYRSQWACSSKAKADMGSIMAMTSKKAATKLIENRPVTVSTAYTASRSR